MVIISGHCRHNLLLSFFRGVNSNFFRHTAGNYWHGQADPMGLAKKLNPAWDLHY